MTFEQWCSLKKGDQVIGRFGTATVIATEKPDRGLRQLKLRYADDAREPLAGTELSATNHVGFELPASADEAEPNVPAPLQTSAQVETGDRFEILSTALLVPSSTNPRKRFAHSEGRRQAATG
jgi:hypothetical protein